MSLETTRTDIIGRASDIAEATSSIDVAIQDYPKGRSEKQFDRSWRVGYIGAVNGNLNLLLSSALLLSRAAVGL